MVTAAVPTQAAIGAFSTEIATADAAKGNYDTRVANAFVTFATAAVVDLTALETRATALEAGSPVKNVRGASTANIANLASFTVAGVDGLTYVAGERILLKDQSTATQNGIYVVGTVGGGTAALTRSTDMDASAEVLSGTVVMVSEGTLYADTAWLLTTNAAITLGSTNLTFTQVPFGFDATIPTTIGSAASSAGTALTAARRDHVHQAMPLTVRGVAVTNVADLAAFVIAGFDGVTYAQGDLVLLANQTTGAESGVYQVGAVSGTAPLTRVSWLPAGAIVNGGFTVHASEGNQFAHSNWFISTTGAITIGTTAHAWYPERVTQSLALVAGTTTISNVPVLSATKTGWAITRRIANTSTATTGGYGPSVGGANGVTAGHVGTASVVIEACVAAGTINNADISTLEITVINR